MKTLSDTNRILAFDGVRGFAVLAVMAVHFEGVLPNGLLTSIFKGVAHLGWIGVDLFFVLSGFLITGILLATRTERSYFGSFYGRRALRILPVYYAAMVAMFTIEQFIPRLSSVLPPAADRGLYFLFLDNWIPAWRGSWAPTSFGHLWSLAVEEQFYLIWPFFVLFLSRRAMVVAIIAMIVLQIVVRVYWSASLGAAAGQLATITRFDGLLVGALCAFYATGERKIAVVNFLRGFLAMFAVFLGLAVLCKSTEAPALTIAFTPLALSLGALVAYLALTDGQANPMQRFFGNGALRRVGRYSYGMYLFHFPIFWLSVVTIYWHLDPSLRANTWFAFVYLAALYAATFFVAMVSFEYFEKPILSLKRLLPERANAGSGGDQRAASAPPSAA